MGRFSDLSVGWILVKRGEPKGDGKKSRVIDIYLRLLMGPGRVWGRDSLWQSLRSVSCIYYFHHILCILSFTHGLTNLQSVLSVLVRNYAFEFPSGLDTTIENVRGLLVRPRIKGESGAGVSLRVRRVEV
jgi:hypothetical protein